MRDRSANARFAFTREESAISIGMSVSLFGRSVQAALEVIPSGQLILVQPIEPERLAQCNAWYLVEPARPRLVG